MVLLRVRGAPAGALDGGSEPPDPIRHPPGNNFGRLGPGRPGLPRPATLPPMTRPVLIALVGVDGSGKTTQPKALVRRLIESINPAP
jgi:hypothetical protein